MAQSPVMAYVVKINGYEVICESVEDVRALVGATVDGSPTEKREGKAQTPPSPPSRNGSDGQRSAADQALLRALYDGGTTGIPSSTVGGLLSAKGKGLPGAFERWADRVGIPRDGAEAVRVGTGRGWRLTDGALAAAKVALGVP